MVHAGNDLRGSATGVEIEVCLTSITLRIPAIKGVATWAFRELLVSMGPDGTYELVHCLDLLRLEKLSQADRSRSRNGQTPI